MARRVSAWHGADTSVSGARPFQRRSPIYVLRILVLTFGVCQVFEQKINQNRHQPAWEAKTLLFCRETFTPVSAARLSHLYSATFRADAGSRAEVEMLRHAASRASSSEAIPAVTLEELAAGARRPRARPETPVEIRAVRGGPPGGGVFDADSRGVGGRAY
jgi:hypothetical protein